MSQTKNTFFIGVLSAIVLIQENVKVESVLPFVPLERNQQVLMPVLSGQPPPANQIPSDLFSMPSDMGQDIHSMQLSNLYVPNQNLLNSSNQNQFVNQAPPIPSSNNNSDNNNNNPPQSFIEVPASHPSRVTQQLNQGRSNQFLNSEATPNVIGSNNQFGNVQAVAEMQRKAQQAKEAEENQQMLLNQQLIQLQQMQRLNPDLGASSSMNEIPSWPMPANTNVQASVNLPGKVVPLVVAKEPKYTYSMGENVPGVDTSVPYLLHIQAPPPLPLPDQIIQTGSTTSIAVEDGKETAHVLEMKFKEKTKALTEQQKWLEQAMKGVKLLKDSITDTIARSKTIENDRAEIESKLKTVMHNVRAKQIETDLRDASSSLKNIDQATKDSYRFRVAITRRKEQMQKQIEDLNRMIDTLSNTPSCDNPPCPAV